MERRSSERPRVDKSVESKKQQPTSSLNTTKEIPETHRRVVFSDPVAFRYLEEDDCSIVVDRLTRIQGYELYVVEQWVCSRTHPTFVICTYTGDAFNSILVNVLAIPRDEQQWSQRLRVYFQAVSQFHAREQDTPLGSLYVTNLSSFPSALTVIAVPDGDVKKHKDELIVNENLKRMGCTGRAAVTLKDPPASTVAKYYHLFATSDAVPLKTSVMELVKVCQLALALYGKLNLVYADGLLCDITERAISDWWDDIGTEFHNIEPSDGLFGPTTVAALLGLLLGAHNRLKSAGIAIGKDVSDVVAMKRSIGHFQKAYRINKTRRLDRETLDRLHRATAKMASGEGWAVPRAVKSTVAELGGKGGEMVMGMVGAKEKVAVAEIETLDIDRFAQLVSGARMKWLWQGKPMKTYSADVFGRQSEDYKAKAGINDDEDTFLWTNTSRGPKDDDEGCAVGNINDQGGHGHGDGKLGRLRDAVGIPAKKSRYSRVQRTGEEMTDSEEVSTIAGISAKRNTHEKHHHHQHHHLHSPISNSSRTSMDQQREPVPALNLALAVSEPAAAPAYNSARQLKAAPSGIADSPPPPYREQLRAVDIVNGSSPTRRRMKRELHQIHDEIQNEAYQKFASEFYQQLPESRTLRHSRSAELAYEVDLHTERLVTIPRRLSSSIFEQTLRYASLGETNSTETTSDSARTHPTAQLVIKEVEIEGLQDLTDRLLRLEKFLLPYAESQAGQVFDFESMTRESLSELNNIYYGRLDDYQVSQATSKDLVEREKASLTDALRKIEVLGQKLDYELKSLQSRMQEVEDGTTEFERNVLEIEARISALVTESHNDGSRVPWMQRMFNFFSK